MRLVHGKTKDSFDLHLLEKINIKVRDFRIITASYWTNEQITIFNTLLGALDSNEAQLQHQVKILLKNIT